MEHRTLEISRATNAETQTRHRRENGFVYFRQGLSGARMIEVKAVDPFAWIMNSIQTMPGTDDNYTIEQFKRNKMICFILGTMKAKNGVANRTNKNVTSRTHVILDNDQKGFYLDEVAERCALMGLRALLYPSPNWTPDHERFRMVLPLVFPIRKPDNYAATVKHAAEILGVPCDPSSATWSQMQGGPIRKPGAPEMIHLEGVPFPVKVAPSDPERPRTSRDRHWAYDRQAGGRISHSDALEIMRRYEARDRHPLQERRNYLSALFHIVKAVQRGEISQATGEECAVILAGNNQEWQANNRKHFNREIVITQPRAQKSFVEKFGYAKQGTQLNR